MVARTLFGANRLVRGGSALPRSFVAGGRQNPP
jgi:hypothetical protein